MRGDAVRVTRTVRHDALDPIVPQLLDGLLDALDVAVIGTDAIGRIELWNDAAERLYGWSAAEAVGEMVGELLVPDSKADEAQKIFDDVAAGDQWKGTFLCRRRDGSTVPVLVTDVPVHDETGAVRAVVGISRDVTDALHADRDTRSLQAMVTASNDAVMTVCDGVFLSWSPAAQRLLGWTEDEAVGRELWFLIPDDLREQAADLSARVSRGESVVAFETDRLTKDGTRLPVSVDIVPVYDAAAQRWVGVVTLRDRRHRDEVIEAAVAAQLQAKYLLARSTEMVMVFEPDMTLRVASSASEHMVGYTPDELQGNVATLLIHPDDAPAAVEAFRQALYREVEHPVVTYRRMTAAGRWSWAEATLTNLIDDPVIHGIVANVRDVTEREEALAELTAREARLSAVVNRSSDVAMFFDREGVVGWVSPAITEALGIEPDSLLGTNAIELVHPEDRNAALRSFMRWQVDSTEHARVEFRFMNAAGEVRWVEQVATDLTDDPSVGYIVANLRDVTERKEVEAELARLALVDDLTGLPNRNALRELAATAMAHTATDRFTAVVFLDLDDFSDVNDAFGHLAGDELLLGVAGRLVDALPRSATLTRFGSDQFVILCEGVADLPEVLVVSEIVKSALAAPFVIDRKEVFAVASVGIAISPPDDVEILLRRADTALHRAKKAGRGQTAVFERKQGAANVRRLHYAAELRHAIANGEIVAHYQPVVDLVTGEAVAVEALARWEHPEMGRVGPDVFVPVAESTGLIGDLGRLILEQACTDAKGWLDAGRRLQVAVNVSAVQVMDPTFPALVAETLAATGLSADQLTLEVTETAALRDLATATSTLNDLRDLGIALSLDDFGTGYSSLSLLKRLPVSALKVDRSFVGGIGTSDEDDQIVTGVVSLALALGFYVVAEGVETEEQAELLRGLDCHFGQGWLWAPAVPSSELLAAIAEFEPDA